MNMPAARKGGIMRQAKLGLDDRINLQAAIAKNLSLKEAAKLLKKSRSTIYREIVNNCYYKEGRHSCAHCQKQCQVKDRFKKGACEQFQARSCHRWKKFPYTCNGCEKSNYCRQEKRYYNCIEAHNRSELNKKVSRTFRQISDDDLLIIDQIVSPGVEKGQSLYHIYQNSSRLQAICSERTIRRYLYRGYLSTTPFKLPRYARYRRKHDGEKVSPLIRNLERLLLRTFSDYCKYLQDHPEQHVWQYDSVEGKKGDKKAILTITYPKFRFQFGFLITSKSSRAVKSKIRHLQKLLGKKFQEIFQVNLSDNGPEFLTFHEVETDEEGQVLCKVFFTNPYRSTDKAHCERNHEFIRYVLPKGVSLDFMTQEKVNLLFSHINAYTRESNQNKTPYQLMIESFGEEFMNAIGIKYVRPEDVLLRPELVR
jgi:IS30 family transposase